MTRLIDRYFIKEFIPPFGFSLFALTFVLLMDQLFRLVDLFVRKGLPFDVVGQILIYTLPLIVSYTAPMAILVAVLMSFGRFGRDNEILALKTSGVSFLTIMRTPFAFVALFMFFLIIFNNTILPETNHRVRNLMIDVSRKRPAVRLPERVFTKEFPGYTIYIGKKDEKHSKIYDVTIYDLKNNLMITAPSGELKNIEEENIISFILYDGELHQLIDESGYQKTKFSKQIINIKIDTDFVRMERTYRTEDEVGIKGLVTTINNTNKGINNLKKEIDELGQVTINRFVKGDYANLDVAQFQIEQKLSTIKNELRKRSRYELELNKKFSLAFACIVFLIIGAPLGYLLKRGGIASVLIGILLFSSYYILILSGEEFASRRGFSPFWAMWLPNLILLVFGLYFFFIAEYERLPFKLRFR